MEEKVLTEEKDIIEVKQSSQEEELFQDYEVNKFKITPSLYKIVAASFLINTVFGFTLSQMDLFQQKACDSAYIGKVCQVLDAAYVGSKFFGTTRTTVDEPYEKTEFDTSDITWVDVSNKELFQYPEGYFYKEEPVQETLAGNEFAMVNGIDGKSTNPGAFLPPGANPFTATPSNPTTTIPNTTTTTPPPSTKIDIKKPPTLPKKNTQMKDDLSGLSIVNTIKPDEKKSTTNKKDDPKKTPNDNNTAGVDPKDVQPTPPNKVDSKKSDGIIINKKPLKDFGAFVLTVKDKVNMDLPFTLTAVGQLTKDGKKLDVKKTNFPNADGDEQLINVIQQGIAAVSDAGYLEYLNELSGKNLKLTVQQDDTNIIAKVESELENETTSKRIQSGLNGLKMLSKLKKTDPDDKDDLTLLENLKITNQGKKLMLEFVIPRPIAKEMITRHLDKLAAEKQTNSLDSKQTGQNLAK